MNAFNTLINAQRLTKVDENKILYTLPKRILEI